MTFQLLREFCHALATAPRSPKLATQESNHPSKSDGGDLGTFKMLDLNEHFRAALIGIAEGEHTGIIELGNN